MFSVFSDIICNGKRENNPTTRQRASTKAASAWQSMGKACAKAFLKRFTVAGKRFAKALKALQAARQYAINGVCTHAGRFNAAGDTVLLQVYSPSCFTVTDLYGFND
ncbi:MAG: hypothetical protein KBH24_05440 [Brachymonas sp.]|nr:hypothetical protein [Brachymonas sp.]